MSQPQCHPHVLNSCSTEHNFATSPFLNLPGEVRNIIYELTLGGNIWDIELDTEARAINLTPKADRIDHRDLLLVCRQIYGESRVLPWSLGSFKCVSETHNSCRAKFRGWVAKFPPEFRRAITSIILASHSVRDARLKDEVLTQWTTRCNLGLQDFPGLKRLQVHAWKPVSRRSTKELREMVMMKPGERIVGNVCVTWVHCKDANFEAMPRRV